MRVQEQFLSQVVRNKTTEKSVLDLVLTKEPDLIDDVQNLGRFVSNDHDLLHWRMNVGQWEAEKEQVRYDYVRMDIKGIETELDLCDWGQII